MGAVFFYHLTRDSAEATARTLLGKCLEAGWRVEVRCPDGAAADRLDQALWGPDTSFLPHGRAGGEHDAHQPVLLTTPGQGAPNGPVALMSLGGAELSPEEVGPLERAFILFDGLDDQAVSRARTQWKAMTGAGCAAKYWSQDSGRWEMKAESGG